MISVGIRELKEKLSGYVDKVRHGEEIVVMHRGKEVALVIPISRERNAVRHLFDEKLNNAAAAEKLTVLSLK